ncbi:hypothetical protein P152DRAFT_397592 [Eremomyces bilateralis CBS 781.70]|uniref:Tc1-like transposase DDE domain-containing protein n=1 Tax=Eremomyces bilateralis CBS 781.70 TaxID=1392243 RepID=A0A6G1G2H0_9PEZI|nr:uncharacterized protein P152DRAFT_397592 [Eremomyces bilateralis CBS 781.70]KAF1812305.1 hypothetical protein P152DRAFT_397592 [Eremomyces bilateralis CBS 781.70]
MHYDPTEQARERIIRQKGTGYRPENIQNRPATQGMVLHIAASCNWYSKSSLKFYHDKSEDPPKPQKPGKPRQKQTETDEQFSQRLQDWKAKLPHKVEVKQKGNSMTQEYYAKHILPANIARIEAARLHHRGSFGADVCGPLLTLQEDNDPSHGTQSNNVASSLKHINWIDCLQHPSQSPDLSPMKALWGILKQRVRKRVWQTMEELKQILIDGWDKITMEEVRKRIAEMPYRCHLVVDNKGDFIKTPLW